MVQLRPLVDRSVAVLLNPASYFSEEANHLDYNEGATFAAILGLIGAVLGVILSGALFSTNVGSVLLITIILGPVMAVIGAAIGAAVIFGICRFLGSRKDYGEAFSIATAAAALYPVNALLNVVPVLGGLLALAWSWWIVTEGIVAIHGIDRGSARLSFGVVYGLLALLGLAA